MAFKKSSGAKKVLLPITFAGDLGIVPAELVGSFNLIVYSSAEDVIYKALCSTFPKREKTKE